MVISDALETVEDLEDDILEELQTLHTEEVQNGIQEPRKEMEPVVYKRMEFGRELGKTRGREKETTGRISKK